MRADLATAQRHVEYTLLRARFPRSTTVDMTAHAVVFGQRVPTAPPFPPVIIGGGFASGAAAGAYVRQLRESRGVAGTLIFFQGVGEVEVYKNAYVFVKDPDGQLITKVLFASLYDAKLFADALLTLKQNESQHPAEKMEHEAQPVCSDLSAGDIITQFGSPSFIYGTYQDPIYVYLAQDKAVVFIFTDRSCIYKDVMALEEVDSFVQMLRARDTKTSNNPQLVH
jgi:hypothetical protein